MFRFKSLTAKFIFISVIILTFLSIYLYADFRFMHHMEGEARRINIAGREMMLTFDITGHMHSIIAGALTPSDRRLHASEAKRGMVEYEESLYGLRDGSDRLGLKPMPEHNKESIVQLNTLVELWEKTQKPTLINIMSLPLERKNESCGMCHSAIRDNFPKIEAS